MSWALEPLQFFNSDTLVEVRTLQSKDIAQTAEVLNEPTGFYGQRWQIDSLKKIEQLLQRQLDYRQLCNPLIYLVKGEIAGISRFMRVDWKGANATGKSIRTEKLRPGTCTALSNRSGSRPHRACALCFRAKLYWSKFRRKFPRNACL